MKKEIRFNTALLLFFSVVIFIFLFLANTNSISAKQVGTKTINISQKNNTMFSLFLKQLTNVDNDITKADEDTDKMNSQTNQESASVDNESDNVKIDKGEKVEKKLDEKINEKEKKSLKELDKNSSDNEKSNLLNENNEKPTVTSSVRFKSDKDKELSQYPDQEFFMESVLSIRPGMNYNNGYSIIELPKKYFWRPDNSNVVASSSFIKSYEIINNKDDVNYKIKINYNDIYPGVTLKIPFKLRVNTGYINNDKVTVNNYIYDNNDNILDQSKEFLTLKTKLPTYSDETYYFTYDENQIENGIIKQPVNKTIDRLYSSNQGIVDTRDYEVSTRLVGNMEYDKSKDINNEWKYDENTKTLSRNISYYYQYIPELPIINKDMKINTTESLIFNVNYQNHTEEEKGETYKINFVYSLKEDKIENKPNAAISAIGYFNQKNSDSIYNRFKIYFDDYDNNIGFRVEINPIYFEGENVWYVKKGYTDISEVTFTPNNDKVDQIYNKVVISLKPGRFNTSVSNDVMNQYSHNRLYGTKVGSDEEKLITTNIKYGQAYDFKDSEIGKYDKLRIVFDNPVRLESEDDAAAAIKFYGMTSENSLGKFKLENNKTLNIPYSVSSKYSFYQYVNNSNTSKLIENNQTVEKKGNLEIEKGNAYAKSLSVDPIYRDILAGESFLYTLKLPFWNPNGTSFKMENPRLIIILPDGFTFDDKTATSNNLDKPEVIKNYNNSGKTAVIAPIKQTIIEGNIDNPNATVFTINIKDERIMKKGDYQIQSYFSLYNNNGSYILNDDTKNQLILNDVKGSDNYYFNKDEINTAKGLKSNEISFKYLPSSAIGFNKLVRKNENNNFVSDLGDYTFVGDEVEYCINAYNYTNDDIDSLEMIDILPFVGDNNLTDNGKKNDDRNTNMDIKLKSLVKSLDENNDIFDIEYSTDNPKGKTYQENKDAKFVKSIDDLSSVTMIKLKIKKDKVLKGNSEVNYTFKVQIPKDLDAKDNTYLAYNNVFNIDSSNDLTISPSAKIKANQKTSNIEVTKLSRDGDFLEGAYFTVHDYNTGETLFNGKEFRTNTSGKILLDKIPTGSYYLEEIKAPDGYTLPMNKNQEKQANKVDVTNSSDEVIKKIIYNAKVEENGRIKFKKIDSNTKKGLSGAKFSLKDTISGQTVDYATSENDGSVEFNNLRYSEYNIIEENAPIGYQKLSDPIKVSINDKAFDIDLKEVINNEVPNGGFKVTKVDGLDNKTKLEGVEFKLYKNSESEDNLVTKDIFGNQITNIASDGTIKTNEDGVINISKIPVGNYVLKETKTLTKFFKYPEKNLEITIDEGNQEKIIPDLVNERIPLRDIKIIKVDSKDNSKKLKDAQFRLVDENGKDVAMTFTDQKITSDDLTTNDQGETKVIKGLKAGETYNIIETKVPDLYKNDVKNKIVRSFKVEEGSDVQEVVIENAKYELGSLTIDKVDSNNNQLKLAGAKFNLYKAQKDGSKGEEVTENFKGEKIELSTGENEYKQIKVDLLPAGEYILEEIKAPTFYSVDERDKETKISIQAEDNKQITVKNTKDKLGKKVVIEKVDAQDQNIKLSGAKFKLYDKNDNEVNNSTYKDIKLDILTISDEKQKIELENVPEGEYKLEEITAPKGYVKLKEKFVFNVKDMEEKQVVEVPNRKEGTLVKFALESSKSTEKNPIYLLGGEFKLYAKPGTKTTAMKQKQKAFLANVVSAASTTGEIVTTDLYGNEIANKDGVLKKSFVKEIEKVDGSGFEATYDESDTGKLNLVLAPGEYYLIQTKVPSGYKIPATAKVNNKVEFIVPESSEEPVSVKMINDTIELPKTEHVSKNNIDNNNHSKNNAKTNDKTLFGLPRTGTTYAIMTTVFALLTLIAIKLKRYYSQA